MCFHLRLEIARAVGAITKWFVFTLAASAQGDIRAACKIIFIAVYVEQLKLTFDANTAVILHRNLCCHRFSPISPESRLKAGFSPTPISSHRFFLKDVLTSP